MTSAFDDPDHIMTGANHVGEGWHQLIRDLEEQLNELDPEYSLQQVKEKFGGLRYYATSTGPYDITFHSLISDAESASFRICEECGEPGTPNSDGGWYKTLCDTHRAERAERISQAFTE
jgi:hypothetical protein